MLQNAYLVAKIGADTAENEQHSAEILPTAAPPSAPPRPRQRGPAPLVAVGGPRLGPVHGREQIGSCVEVEMLGGPWNDLLGDARPIYEGTDVEAWVSAGCPHHTTPDMAIDWLSEP